MAPAISINLLFLSGTKYRESKKKWHSLQNIFLWFYPQKVQSIVIFPKEKNLNAHKNKMSWHWEYCETWRICIGKMKCAEYEETHGNFHRASSSLSHTMSVLSDLQPCREVLAPGTQARSCYHDITRGRQWTVSAQLGAWGCGGGRGAYLGVLWSSVNRATTDCGWMEMRETWLPTNCLALSVL